MSAACPLLGQGSRFIIQLRCFMVEGVDSRLENGPYPYTFRPELVEGAAKRP